MNRRYEYNDYDDRSQRRRARQSRHEEPPKRKRSSGRWFLLFLVVIVAALWFAPAILLKTELRNKIVGWAAPDFPGRVVIGSGSAGWMSPIELRDVSVWDADGEAICSIPLITSEKEPSAWLTNPKQLGTFKLHNPEVHLVITQDSSNVETLLQPFLESDATDEPAVESTNPADQLVGMSLEIIEGRVLINDQVAQTTAVVEDLNLQLKVPEAPPAPIELNVSAVAQQDALRGNIAADFSWLMPENITESDLGDGTVKLTANGFPLVALQPLLRRSNSDLYVSGQLVSDLNCQWRRTTNGPAIEASGSAGINQPFLQMPSVLGTDRLTMQSLKTALSVTSQDNLINLNSVKVNSDIANLEITGTAELKELFDSGSIVSTLLDFNSSHQFQVRGNVDIAGLARQLPSTIRVRKDTQISLGQISLNCLSRIELGQRVVQAAVRTGRIEAVTAGRPVSWDKPLQVNLNAVSSADGVTIQQLNCESDFLTITASGTLERGDLTAQGNLDELITQIGQFCDVGDLQLSGQMATNGKWQRTPAGQYESALGTVITNFAATSSQISPIHEDKLNVTSSGRFSLDKNNELQKIDLAQLEIASGEDKFIARLSSPIAKPTADTRWPVSLKLVGHTETWIARLQPFVDTTGIDVHAGINATMNGTVHTEQVALNPIQIELTNLAAKSPGWLIREPAVKLEGSLDWNAGTQTIATPSLTLTSSAVAARAENINITINGEQTTATGNIVYGGNLQKIWSWQYSDQPLTTFAQGDMQGQANLATQNGQITFRAQSEIKDFVLQQRNTTTVPTVNPAANPWTPVWNESNLRVIANGTYDPVSDKLTLAGAEANGEGVTLVAGGNLTQLMGTPQADIRGEIGYDLAVLTTKLQPSLGPNVRLTGNKKAQFVVAGPLLASSVSVTSANQQVTNAYGQPGIQQAAANLPSTTALISPDLHGEAGLGWDSVEAFGISMGPQDISTRLQQGTLFFSPLQTTVGGGQVHLAPRIEFNASPMTLALDEGSIEQVQITPEMFQTWFKYIAPLLANAATAEGQLSVALNQVRVPLEQPMGSSLAGKVVIHGARVEAGPMAQQVLGVVREVSTLLNRSGPKLDFLNAGEKWMEIAPQDIDFQMANGRVYHRNLELRAGKVPIRTQGWVGVDQTVGMLAEIPVQNDWIEGRKLLEGLRGQSIQIPVHGTFAKPQLERGAVAKLSKQLIGNTAERLIHQELQKGLQKLLGPR